MRSKILILATTVLMVGALLLHAQNTRPPYEPLRLPGGKAFPASQEHLLRLRDKAGAFAVHKMRKHAWDLFIGLTQDDPIWNTWFTKCDVRLVTCDPSSRMDRPDAHQILKSLEVPVQSIQVLGSPVVDGLSQQTDALGSNSFNEVLRKIATAYRVHPQFASVLFNKEAADHILGNCLNLPVSNTNSALPCPPLPAPPGMITPFDSGAVVLKTVWARMVVGNDSVGTFWAWDPEVWNTIQKPNESIDNFYKPSIKVQIDSKAKCRNGDYSDEEIVPISCFYAFQVTQTDMDALKAFPESLSIITNTGTVRGNYLVLVGVHVTTKEIPDWVWATFWWGRKGKSDPKAADRPKGIAPLWNHFLMDTTLSTMTPREKDKGPKICFNPNLETMQNGAISNCMQCHSKAGYGSKSALNPYDLGILGRDGRTLASGNIPSSTSSATGVETDFIWSIADAQDTPKRTLIDLFEKQLQLLEQEELNLHSSTVVTDAPPKR